LQKVGVGAAKNVGWFTGLPRKIMVQSTKMEKFTSQSADADLHWIRTHLLGCLMLPK